MHNTTYIIQPLTEALQRGALALFIGGDMPQSLTGVPSRVDMARALAQRYGIDEGASLARVAQQVGQGGHRREFTVFLREQLQGAQTQPFHLRVVDLVRGYNIQTLITTAYDDLLRRAFDAVGVPVEVVWKDGQLAVAFRDRPHILQLYGNPLSDVESLVVTEDDHLDLARDRSREDVLDEVRSVLRRNTVLFLGYALSDPDFLLLWRGLIRHAGDLHRRAFAVWPGLTEAEVGVWADRGIVILEADPWGLVGDSATLHLPSQPAHMTLPQSAQPVAMPVTVTPGIPDPLYQTLQATLLRCGPFRSDNGLPPLFVDSRISQWRDILPSRDTPAGRVQAVIDTLVMHANAEGKNALVLLLHVLRDHASRRDACYGQLAALAKELEKAGI
ncbi:MAG: SIR2 family protein [Anaerolineae bacterium]|nr:SIR2 family protein [Anaerolineae bacterium]